MSLVGTRPPTVDEWDKYELHHRARLATKPGLTGMWQVSGRSNITDFGRVFQETELFLIMKNRNETREVPISMDMRKIQAGTRICGKTVIKLMEGRVSLKLQRKKDGRIIHFANKNSTDTLYLGSLHCGKIYLTVMYHNGFLVLQDILQIMVLFLTRNFILFLVIAVVCTIIGNICMSRKADRLFPYLKEPCKEQLPQEERHDILRNVKAMLMHKIGNVVVNNTDNLLISSFVGIISAGIYSNYYLIIGSVRQVLEQAMLGVAASVGNLGVTEENEKIHCVCRCR